MGSRQLYFDFCGGQGNAQSARAAFVPHSGCQAALDSLAHSVAATSRGAFSFLFLWGPPGVGKTHLLRLIKEEHSSAGLPQEQLSLWDDFVPAACPVETFVATYQQLQASGGLMVVASREGPAQPQVSPHLSSRLVAGVVQKLDHPSEAELFKVIESLSLNMRLRLRPEDIDYLVARVSRNVLSFESILASITDSIFSRVRPRRTTSPRPLIRQQVAG